MTGRQLRAENDRGSEGQPVTRGQQRAASDRGQWQVESDRGQGRAECNRGSVEGRQCQLFSREQAVTGGQLMAGYDRGTVDGRF